MIGRIITIACLVSPAASFALTFALPEHDNVVGGIQTVRSQQGESLGDIGRRFDIGVYEMIEANPDINPWSIGAGKEIIIPAKFILPPGEREGIVINLAEMRLYYYHPDANLVSTHPIGIGRKGWRTPTGTSKITEKKKDPDWRPPKSIKASYARKGKILPDVVPAGPDNPLGQYAMRLSMPGYLIHGTNKPGGIGVRSSSGCIRMYPEDIEALFHKTKIGTKVRIIHAPYKVGYKNGNHFIEAHEPLSEKYYQELSQEQMLEEAITQTNLPEAIYIRGWDDAKDSIDRSNGIPVIITR